MSDQSPRHALPYILPGQAQKEAFHNEGFARIDALLHSSAIAIANDPPAEPEAGQCWIVGTRPGGAWAGHSQALAGWTSGGWQFFAPRPGMSIWVEETGFPVRWTGNSWSARTMCEAVEIGGEQVVGNRQPAVLSPSNGTIIDQEARLAISQIIVALRSHGLTY